MSELSIEVQPRERSGSVASRRLRREGIVPAVVYGGGKDPVAIQVDRKTLLDLFRQTGSENAVFLLKLGEGKQRHCMVRELEVDPITRKIVHVDFLRIDLSEKVRVQVAVEIVGVPYGVKNESGILDVITREVEVECLPNDIPRHLDVDVSELHVGQHVEVSSLTLPAGVTLHDDPHKVLASVVAPRVAAAEEEGEGLLEAERTEPELVGRGKAAAEEEDEG